MQYTIDLLKPAARAANDVAVLIDAARVLTFLARSRTREHAVQPVEGDDHDLTQLYDAASRLSQQARRRVAETQRLLSISPEEPPRLNLGEQVAAQELNALHSLMVNAMQEAARALDTLECIQELGADQLDGPPPDAQANAELNAYVQRLMARLRG